MNDKYFESEIKSIHSALREFKDNRKQFNVKIAQIAKPKSYQPSSYGTDMQQCLAGLAKLSIDPQNAKTICENQFAGKGTISGTSKSASVQKHEVPAWAVTYDYINNKGVSKNLLTVTFVLLQSKNQIG